MGGEPEGKERGRGRRQGCREGTSKADDQRRGMATVDPLRPSLMSLSTFTSRFQILIFQWCKCIEDKIGGSLFTPVTI